MSEMHTLLIRKADIIDELDVGGEIGEVALGVSDAALPNTLAMRRLPSGKLGWVDNCDLRLPVGLLPAEWHGRALLVTFSLAPYEAAETTEQAPPVAEQA